MKNQWFGDIHDFRKYGLLRFLSQTNQFQKIFIAWMLTPSEKKDKCGNYRSFKDYPSRWRECDETLFDILKTFNNTKNKTFNVSQAFKLGILPEDKFIPFENNIEKIFLASRDDYFRKIKNSNSDLVFLDADNGLEVASMNDTTKPKYVCYSEVQSLYKTGKSILIYQHRAIGQSFETQIAHKLNKLGELAKCPMIVFRGGNVSYILLCRNDEQVQCIVKSFTSSAISKTDYYLRIQKTNPVIEE